MIPVQENGTVIEISNLFDHYLLQDKMTFVNDELVFFFRYRHSGTIDTNSFPDEALEINIYVDTKIISSYLLADLVRYLIPYRLQNSSPIPINQILAKKILITLILLPKIKTSSELLYSPL